MIDTLPVQTMLRAARAGGGDFAEIFCEASERTSVVCDDNRIETVTAASDSGMGLRVIRDGRTTYGSTNDFVPDNLQDVAASVGRASARGNGSPRVIAALSPKPRPPRLGFKTHPSALPLERKVDFVRRANHIARTAHDRIAQVKVVLRDHIRRVWITASDGTETADEQVYVTFIVQVISADGNLLQTSYEPVGGMKGYELLEETTPEEVAAAAAKRALLMLGAAPAPSGAMPVVLAGTAGGTMIHEAVGHGLEADLAEQGLSVYRNRLGGEVASPVITVYDDATLPGHRGSFNIDDEGVPAERTCLIERGILKTYLHNRVSATLHGGVLTGNGRRQTYAHAPIVRMTNTFIDAGSDRHDDIVRATERGLYVKKIGGGQVNTVNGDFVFHVQEGYRIEHGRIGEPVRDATLTGNGPKVLTMIDKVGDDIGYAIGTCGKYSQEIPVSSGQPTLRIPEIIVGGTAS